MPFIQHEPLIKLFPDLLLKIQEFVKAFPKLGVSSHLFGVEGAGDGEGAAS